MIGYHMLCKVPSAQTSRCSEAQQTIRVIRISSWQLVPHFSGSPGSWLCSSSLATTPKQFSSHSVLCSHTCRPSLGANTGWGQEESQQISHERLLACPSQPGFHENTLHGSLCEFPLPVGQESHRHLPWCRLQHGQSVSNGNSGLQPCTAWDLYPGFLAPSLGWS